jgi:GT2 family glycosyltransferase
MNSRSCDVVIATRNRAAQLRRCLDGLRRQSFDDFGVIVVDDCSDEPLEGLLTAQDRADLDLTVITLADQSGPAAARNAGVAASEAVFVAFVDDDIVPNRHFLKLHLDAVRNNRDVPTVSFGPFLQPADWTPAPWTLWEAQHMKREADNLLSGKFAASWRQFHTGNNCLPRDIFNELGGFDETFKRAEDDELALRLYKRGCCFTFVPDAIAYHYPTRSLESWLLIPRLYAYYDVVMDRRDPEIGYLAKKKQELRERRLPVRLARAVFATGWRNRFGIKLATSSAELLYRIGLVPLAMGGFSVAYDLTYFASMRSTERRLPAAD